MESRLAEVWTPSEIEEARSLLNVLNDNDNSSNNNRDDTNTKHNGIAENLLKLFPWKTIEEVTELHVELIAERHMMQSREKSSGGGDMRDVDPLSTFISNSFGISDEEKAMLDAEDLLLDYPLEEILETQDVPVVKEDEEEVLENQADCQPVVPRKGMPWTTEEHSLFLQGVSVLGRGKWKSISKHFVTTRTPVQISSHAQKYFQKMERNATAKRQRRGVVTEFGNRWMKNTEFAARAFAFAGVNYNPCLGLPPNPSFLEDLAKIWSPLLYRPQASQAWGERVVVPAAAPMEGAWTSAAAGHGASLPQQWTGSMH